MVGQKRMNMRQALAIAVAAVSVLEAVSSQAATFTWSGNGSSVNWSVGGNWAGTAPGTDADLVFTGTNNTGTSGTPLNQNLGSPYTFNSITFDSNAGAFFIGGSDTLDVGGGATITQSSSSAQSITNSIIQSGNSTTLTLTGNGTGVVTLTGNLQGKSNGQKLSVSKTGTSIFVLSGTGSNVGTIAINGGALVAGSTGSTLDGATGLTVGAAGTLGVASGVTFSQAATWTALSTLAGLGTYTPGSTFTVGGSGHATTIAPGIADGTDNVGTLTLGNAVSFASGGTLDIDLNGASADKLAVTGAVTVASGALLDFNAIAAPTAGKYALLTASSGTFTNSFTTSGLPSGYKLALNGSSNELDLIHLADQTLTAASPATINIISGSTVAISALLTDSAPSSSVALNVTLADNGGTGGAVSGLSSSTGSSVAVGTPSTISGTFTAGSAGLGKTWSIKNTDGSAVTTSVSAGGTVNVYTHAAGQLSVTSATTVNALTGAAINSTFTFMNNGATNDGLTIQSLGGGLSNLSGTFAGNGSTNSVTGSFTAGAAGTSNHTFTATWLEDLSVTGATSGNQNSTASVMVNSYNPAVVTATPTSSPVLDGGSVTYNNTTATLAAGAQATTFTVTQGLNGTFNVTNLLNTVVTGGGNAVANVTFTPAANLLNGAASTGGLTAGFTNVTPTGGAVVGSAANDASGGTTFNHTLSYTSSGAFAPANRTGGISDFGTAQTADVLPSGSLAGLSSQTSAMAADSPNPGDRQLLGTTATILAGTNPSAVSNMTLSMQWRSRLTTEVYPGIGGPFDSTPNGLYSDVVNIGGITSGTPYVLAMTYDSQSALDASVPLATLALGYYNGSSWVNAVYGNTGNNATMAEQGYVGSFASFETLNGTDITQYMGAYGVDTATNTVWAVLDHASEFAVVPEPMSLGLLGLGAAGLLLRRRRR